MFDSNLDHIILFCAGWWIFATVAAFIAALLFWNKGASHLSGPIPGASSMAVKLTGASAIWGFTLLLFSFVDPTKIYGDAKGLLLVSVQEKRSPGLLGPRSVEVRHLPGIDFDKSLNFEMIPRDSIFTLMPEGNTFAYWKPIPAGVYELRVTDEAGSRKSYQVLVPPAHP